MIDLSKIKKIYTNGSSITWGWLFDNEEVKRLYSNIGIFYESRSSVIWPGILANKLNLDLHEDSRWGGSLDRLIRKTYEYCFSDPNSLKETLFILEIPHGFRTELFSNTLDRIVNITHGNINSPSDLTEDSDYSKIHKNVTDWFMEFGDVKFHFNEQALKMIGLISFLEINKAEYFIMGGEEYLSDERISYDVKSVIDKLSVSKRFIKFDGDYPFCIFKWYSRHLKKSLMDEIGFPNNHPGIQAHRIISEYVYLYLKYWPSDAPTVDSNLIFPKRLENII